MKPFKNLLLLFPLLVISASGFCAYNINVPVQMNQCYYDSIGSPNGLYLDSVQLITPPVNGTLSGLPGHYTYCPNQGFIGHDSMLVYACVNGLLSFCDTFHVLFDVTCGFNVNLVQDSNAICIGGNRHFTAVPSGGTPPYTYLWDDGSTLNNACELMPGMTNCVTVTDAIGCQGQTCIGQNGCQLYISFVSNICGGPLPSVQPVVTGGTPPYTYLWNDGVTFVTRCNLITGTYCVMVTDANGCSGNGCYTVQGTGGCFFTYNAQSPLLATQINFYSGNDTSFSPVSWIWTFDDGTIDTAANPIHIFSSGGYYHVCMNTIDGNGDSCSYCEYVYAYPDSNNYGGCQACFYNYIDSANTNAFHFVDYSVYGPVTWAWDFGDGDTSAIQNPTHTYSGQGTWNVCLTITDSRGCSSNYCQQISNIPVQDLEAYLYHQTTIAPGFPVWVYLSYYNSGTILMNGTVQYRYPAGTTVNATGVIPAAHDVANRLLTFNFSNLMPGTSDYIYVDLNAGASLVLGSLAADTLWVNPVSGDITPANNVSFVIDSVVGSWDPNDKAVSPKGEGDNGIIPLNTTEISYRIRFQNTGNAPAQTVAIHDIISNNIDLTTVKVTDASHPHSTEIIGNELIVTFSNINLPDSGSSYLASQGFINIHAMLKPGLTNGARILNTADIYFDFNAPVITNTVVTTLGSNFSNLGSIGNFDFAIMPNPASSQISLRGEFEKGSEYVLMNQLGQVLIKGQINADNTLVKVADLSSGVYLVKIRSGEKTGVQKLALAK